MYSITIFKDDEKVGRIDSVPPETIIALLIELKESKASVPPPIGKPEKAKKEKKPKKEKFETDDAPINKRGKIALETITQIEDMLKEGKTVAEVCAEIDVSNPTVYLVRTRLRNQGDLE